MTIDVSALRKFQEVFGPAIEAIPAVINMAESQADMNRAVEKARKDYQAMLDQHAQLEAGSKNALAALAQQREDAKAALDKIKTETAVERKNSKAEREDAERQHMAAMAAKKAEIDLANVKLSQIDSEIAAKLAEAEAQKRAKMAELDEEIRARELRKAEIQEAIDSLKAKLG